MSQELAIYARRIQTELRKQGLDLSLAQTRGILDLFLEALAEDLNLSGRATLTNFGTFQVEEDTGVVELRFRPSQGLRHRVRGFLQRRGAMAMDKFSVVQKPEEEEGDKTAGAVNLCPEPGCGKPLQKDASVKKCPEHGTKPFEPKEGD